MDWSEIWTAAKPLVLNEARRLLAVAAGALIAHGALAPGEQGAFIEIALGLSSYAAAFLWGVYKANYQAKVEAALKRVTARSTTADAVATAKAAPPGAAVSIITGLMLVVLASMTLAPPANAAPRAKDSFAQIKLPIPLSRPAAAPAATPAPKADPIAKMMDDLSAIQKDVVDGVIADLTAADADAATIDSETNQMRDQIAHACYPAQIKFLQSLPQAVPMTGKYQLVQLFQRKRDFVAQIKAGLPTYLKLGCAALIGDELQTFIQTIGLIGIKVIPTALTAMFPALAPVTLPALSILP